MIHVQGRPGAGFLPVNLRQLENDLKERHGKNSISYRDVMSSAMYPKVFDDFKWVLIPHCWPANHRDDVDLVMLQPAICAAYDFKYCVKAAMLAAIRFVFMFVCWMADAGEFNMLQELAGQV